MDKILLKNLAFHGYHGVFQEEKSLGQRFYIDIELSIDLTEAGSTDCYEDTVSYVDIFNIAKRICEEERYNLIEALAQNIGQAILAFNIKIQEVVVRVRKPQAPVPGNFDYFAVEIRRAR